MGTQTRPPLSPSEARRVPLADDAQEAASSSRITKLVTSVERFCRERPLTAIGVGIVFGMVLRAALSRR